LRLRLYNDWLQLLGLRSLRFLIAKLYQSDFIAGFIVKGFIDKVLNQRYAAMLI
jgi:hypothetical protein